MRDVLGGIGPFQSFKPFNRFAPFKTFPGMKKRGTSTRKPSAAEPQSMIHRRGTEFAEFGVFLIKNSLLRALRASAVSSLLDRDNQNSH